MLPGLPPPGLGRLGHDATSTSVSAVVGLLCPRYERLWMRKACCAHVAAPRSEAAPSHTVRRTSASPPIAGARLGEWVGPGRGGRCASTLRGVEICPPTQGFCQIPDMEAELLDVSPHPRNTRAVRLARKRCADHFSISSYEWLVALDDRSGQLASRRRSRRVDTKLRILWAPSISSDSCAPSLTALPTAAAGTSSRKAERARARMEDRAPRRLDDLDFLRRGPRSATPRRGMQLDVRSGQGGCARSPRRSRPGRNRRARMGHGGMRSRWWPNRSRLACC